MSDDYMSDLESMANQFEAEASESKTEIVDVGTTSQEAPDDKSTIENQIRDIELRLGEKPEEEKKDDEENSTKDPNDLLLGQLNQLGILRHGLPVEFKDMNEAKEVLSKGFDYTQKTQELANEKKQFQEQMAQQQNEIEVIRQEAEKFREEQQDKILENELMGQILSDIQKSDPEIFELIANAYNQKMSLINFQKNNPAIQNVSKELNSIKAQLAEKQKAEQKEVFNKINSDWESGLASTQKEFAKTLAASGIKPNWTEVQNIWKADATGKTSVSSAFLAVHGKDLLSAMNAKNKAAEAKAKVAQRVGPAKVSGTTKQKPSQHSSTSYMNYIEELAAKF